MATTPPEGRKTMSEILSTKIDTSLSRAAGSGGRAYVPPPVGRRGPESRRGRAGGAWDTVARRRCRAAPRQVRGGMNRKYRHRAWARRPGRGGGGRPRAGRSAVAAAPRGESVHDGGRRTAGGARGLRRPCRPSGTHPPTFRWCARPRRRPGGGARPEIDFWPAPPPPRRPRRPRPTKNDIQARSGPGDSLLRVGIPACPSGDSSHGIIGRSVAGPYRPEHRPARPVWRPRRTPPP